MRKATFRVGCGEFAHIREKTKKNDFIYTQMRELFVVLMEGEH